MSEARSSVPPPLPSLSRSVPSSSDATPNRLRPHLVPLPGKPKALPTAVIYCEGNFTGVDGKTANGLVRHSEAYKVLAVIDSQKAGVDAGVALGDKANGIPICRNLAEVRSFAAAMPDYFVYGMAPASGMLSAHERTVVLSAIKSGMNVVSGLHEFLSDDPEFASASIANHVELRDVRKPRDKKDLRTFSGQIARVTCPRIAVLGTDCAIGKRTTATILTKSLKERGLNAVMIYTGQTGAMQGGRYGAALDAVPSQFCAGELEAAIVDAFDTESPDVIIIEGQGALGHPAYSTSSFILRGSCPDGVVLQHAPGRLTRCDFEQMPMPHPAKEIHLIETFSDTKVIGLTLSHENMTDDEIGNAISLYEKELGIPTTDALGRPTEFLTDMVLSAYPELKRRATAGTQ